MKRSREELEREDAEDQPEQPAAAQQLAAAAAEAVAPNAQQQQQQQQQPAAEEDSDDDKPLFANYRMSRNVRKGAECPYLDTISRQVRAATGWLMAGCCCFVLLLLPPLIKCADIAGLHSAFCILPHFAAVPCRPQPCHPTPLPNRTSTLTLKSAAL